MNLKIILARAKKKTLQKVFKVTDKLLQTDHYWRYKMQNNGYHISSYAFRKDQIAFVHMPKTGGTSFQKILKNHTTDRFINVKVHRPISKSCPVETYKYVTILRNPVDRVWSYYQMVLRNPDGYPYKKYAVKGLESFLQKCWAAQDMSCQYYTARVYEKVNQGIYEEALNKLSKFHDILLFQNFTEDVSLFVAKHNISFKSDIPHERKVSYKQPTDSEIALIEKFNHFDILLFKHFTNKK